MRWRALFDDLEAQWDAAERSDFEAEVRDRTRRELALLSAVDRLAAAHGRRLVLSVSGAGIVTGALLDSGPDWCLLEQGSQEVLVPLAAVLTVSGLGRAAQAPQVADEVQRRLDLRWALRGLARGRAPVRLLLRDGAALTGTLDRVGADHVDLAEHGLDQARRAAAVIGVRLVPLPAIALLRTA